MYLMGCTVYLIIFPFLWDIQNLQSNFLLGEKKTLKCRKTLEIWHPCPHRTFAPSLWRLRGPKQTRAALLVRGEQDELHNKDLDGKAEEFNYISAVTVGYKNT